MNTDEFNDDLLPLFDQVKIDERMEAMRAAEKAANEAFKEEYKAFLRGYAATHEVFASEDVQLAYKARTDLPQPREWRATGGITNKLLRDGELHTVGTRLSGIYCRQIALLSRNPRPACPTCGQLILGH